MKKVIFCFIAATLLPFLHGSAQSNISFGPTAGANLSKVSNLEGTYFLPGFNAGLFLIWAPGEHIGVGGEARYSQEGVKTESGDEGSDFYTESTVHMNYIRVPLRLTYFFGSYTAKVRPKLFIGPTLGFLASAHTESDVTAAGVTTSSDVDSKDDLHGFDLGVHAGAGINFRISEKGVWLNFDALYTQGLTDVTENDDATNLNQNISVNIGLAFPMGYSK